MTTNSGRELIKHLRKRHHSQCIVCGDSNGQGLHLDFSLCEDGSVEASFPCDLPYQGYDGILHGGIISCLLDGAMTNCLFSQGITAATGELVMRFHHPVVAGVPAKVIARVSKARPPLHLLESELTQDDRLMVRATAKFMETRWQNVSCQ